MADFIYTMHKVSRSHPPNKEVLVDISLNFLPGAKIGILGYNGAGKSTLLRIMAGTDNEYRGEAQLRDGATVGMLEQEPQLDETKDVRGNVEDGVRETKDLLDRFNELAANYSDETAEEFGRLQAKIDAADAWNLDTMLDSGALVIEWAERIREALPTGALWVQMRWVADEQRGMVLTASGERYARMLAEFKRQVLGGA